MGPLKIWALYKIRSCLKWHLSSFYSQYKLRWGFDFQVTWKYTLPIEMVLWVWLWVTEWMAPREWEKRTPDAPKGVRQYMIQGSWCMSSKGRAQSQSIEILQGNPICFFSPFFCGHTHMDDNHLKWLPHTHHPCTCHWYKVGSGVMSFESGKRWDRIYFTSSLVQP